MLKKVTTKFKEILKNNYKFILAIIVLSFISFYEFPYYVSAPGGVANVASRVEIDDAKEVKGSFNMAYVSEYKATLPILIYAKLNDDWDIEKKSDVLATNQTDKDLEFWERILLKEASQDAVIYAYQKALKKVNITESNIYVTYVYSETNTDLKVGDKIISIDDVKVTDKNHLNEEINKHKNGDKVTIHVSNNDKEYDRYAYILEIENDRLIGILVSELVSYEVYPEIKLKFDASESGPSGGLMTSLTIYNYLVDEDITHGLKIAGTGTIDRNGNVGSIGGVKYKILGAVKDKVKHFIIPAGENYEEAKKLVEERNFDITLYPVSTFDEALDVLRKIK